MGLGTILLGYSVFYYGLTQIQGGNWGYFDLIIPARWTDPNVVNTPRDGNDTGSSTVGPKGSKVSTTTKGGPGLAGQAYQTLKSIYPFNLLP